MNLHEYARLALSQGAKCWICQRTLGEKDLLYRGPHSDGWIVDGYPYKLWLYFRCPKQTCRYETSLAKLGIERPEPRDTAIEIPVVSDHTTGDAATIIVVNELLGSDHEAPPEPAQEFGGFGGGQSGGAGGGGNWVEDDSKVIDDEEGDDGGDSDD